jgi:hypothetical protein
MKARLIFNFTNWQLRRKDHRALEAGSLQCLNFLLIFHMSP